MSLLYVLMWILLIKEPNYIGQDSKWDRTQLPIKIVSVLLYLACLIIPIANWQWGLNWWTVLSIAGCTLQLWARDTLGQYYTSKLCIQPGQTLIKSGPYKFMDHPGYIGVLLFTVGECITYPVLVLWGLTAIYSILLAYRIKVEDEMLKELK